MTQKPDPLDMRYGYDNSLTPADGLRSMVFDKARGLQLVLTSVKSIDPDAATGDFTVTIRARRVVDMDEAADPLPVWGIHLSRSPNSQVRNNRVYNIDRTVANDPRIGVLGDGAVVSNNVVSKIIPASGVTLTGNVLPDYATAPQMSLVD